MSSHQKDPIVSAFLPDEPEDQHNLLRKDHAAINDEEDTPTKGNASSKRYLKVDDALNEAGNADAYQYRVLFILSIQFVTLSFVCFSPPFLFLPPNFVLKSDSSKTCPETLRCSDLCNIDRTRIVNSVSWEFDIHCSFSYYISLQGSVFFACGTISVLFVSALVDRFGRRIPLFICLLFAGLLTVASSFVSNITWFIVIFGAVGFFFIPFVSLSYVLLGESGDQNFGGKATAILNCSWGLAEILFVMLAYYIGDWRQLTRWVIGIPMIVSSLGFFWILNPPKHSYSQRNYTDAKKEILEIANVNERDLHSFSLLNEQQDNKMNKNNILDLFKVKSLRRSIFVLTILFFVCDYSYNGILYALNDIAGNIYIIGALIGAAEIVGYFLSGLVVHYLKRRTGFFFFFLISSLCYFANFLPFSKWFPNKEVFGQGFSIFIQGSIAAIARLLLSINLGILYIYANERIPTPVRGIGIGVITFIARFGSIIAPEMNHISKSYGIQTMASYGVLNFAIVLLVPFIKETFGDPLPDKILSMITPQKPI